MGEEDRLMPEGDSFSRHMSSWGRGLTIRLKRGFAVNVAVDSALTGFRRDLCAKAESIGRIAEALRTALSASPNPLFQEDAPRARNELIQLLHSIQQDRIDQDGPDCFLAAICQAARQVFEDHQGLGDFDGEFSMQDCERIVRMAFDRCFADVSDRDGRTAIEAIKSRRAKANLREDDLRAQVEKALLPEATGLVYRMLNGQAGRRLRRSPRPRPAPIDPAEVL